MEGSGPGPERGGPSDASPVPFAPGLARAGGLGLGRRLVKNSAWNIFSFVISSLITIATAPLYINYLGLDGYGLLVILNSILTPLALLNLGFGQATIKYVAENYSAHRMEEAGRYLQSTLLFNVGIGLLGMLVIYLGAVPLADAFKLVEPQVRGTAIIGFRLVAVGWFFNQIASTFMGVAVAQQRFRLHSVCGSFVTSGGVLFGLLVLAMPGGNFTRLMIFRAIWGGATALTWALISRRLLPGVSLWPRYNKSAFHNSFHFGVWQTVASVGGILALQTDKLLLGRFRGTEAVGIYSVPTTAFMQSVAVVGRLAEVLFPAISNLQGQKRDRAMVDLMLRGSWLIALLMVSAQTTLMVFADDVLRLYMHGKLPGVATSILRLSCAGAIVTAATPGVSQFLLGTGRTGWMAWMSISAGVLTLVADLILIPTKGINGAAWGGAMAVIISRPLIYLLLWFKIFRATTSFRKQFAYLLGPSIPGIVLALALQTLHDELKPSLGWIGLGFWSLVTFGFSGLLLVWIDGFLPESAQRRADLYSLLRLVTRQ